MMMSEKPSLLVMEMLSCLNLTWYDDVREAESLGDGDVPGEEAHVVLPDLLHVSVEQLQ